MSDQPRAEGRNAADPRQVKRAGRLERDRAEQLRAHVVAVLTTESGRAVFWELLERAGVYRSIWTPNSEIHYKAGRQDFGHELMALIVDASEEGYELMEREARARRKRDERSTDAAHTAPAEETT